MLSGERCLRASRKCVTKRWIVILNALMPSKKSRYVLLYSTEENSHAYLSKQGIDNLRQLFFSEIFKDEIHEVYDHQTEMRNRITQASFF